MDKTRPEQRQPKPSFIERWQQTRDMKPISSSEVPAVAEKPKLLTTEEYLLIEENKRWVASSLLDSITYTQLSEDFQPVTFDRLLIGSFEKVKELIGKRMDRYYAESFAGKSEAALRAYQVVADEVVNQLYLRIRNLGKAESQIEEIQQPPSNYELWGKLFLLKESIPGEVWKKTAKTA